MRYIYFAVLVAACVAQPSTLNPCPFDVSKAPTLQYDPFDFRYILTNADYVYLHPRAMHTMNNAEKLPKPSQYINAHISVELLGGIYKPSTGIISFTYWCGEIQPCGILNTEMISFGNNTDPLSYLVFDSAVILDKISFGRDTGQGASLNYISGIGGGISKILRQCSVGNTIYQFVQPNLLHNGNTNGAETQLNLGSPNAISNGFRAMIRAYTAQKLHVTFAHRTGAWPDCPFVQDANLDPSFTLAATGSAAYSHFGTALEYASPSTNRLPPVPTNITSYKLAVDFYSNMVTTRSSYVTASNGQPTFSINDHISRFDRISQALTQPGTIVTFNATLTVTSVSIDNGNTRQIMALPTYQCIVQNTSMQLKYLIMPPSIAMSRGLRVEFDIPAVPVDVTLSLIPTYAGWPLCPYYEADAITVAFNTATFDYNVRINGTTTVAGHYATQGTPVLTSSSQLTITLTARTGFLILQYTDNVLNPRPAFLRLDTKSAAYLSKGAFVSSATAATVSLDTFGPGAGVSPPAVAVCTINTVPVKYTQLDNATSVHSAGFFAGFSVGSTPSVISVHIIRRMEQTTSTTTTTVTTTSSTTDAAQTTPFVPSDNPLSNQTTAAYTGRTRTYEHDMPLPSTDAPFVPTTTTTTTTAIDYSGDTAVVAEASWAPVAAVGGTVLIVLGLVLACMPRTT